MHPEIRTTADTLAFDTTLVGLALDDFDDAASRQRHHGDLPSVAWLAGHLIAGRHNMARLVGLELDDPWQEHFGTEVACTDGEGYPTMDEIRQTWTELSERLLGRLGELEAKALAAPSKAGPAADQTVRGALGFWTWHETYHVGQLGLVRARMGRPTVRDLFYQHHQRAKAAGA